MRPLVMFVTPVHGRVELAKLCLDELAWCCTMLESRSIPASAVVVGDDAEILEHATELGFRVVTQRNEPVARKFNDGIVTAHRAGASYVIPCGSDNWVHPDWFSEMVFPSDNKGEVVCHQACMIVSPTGDELVEIHVSYDGGDGIRVFPINLFKELGYRPAANHRNRAIDTSIWERLRREAGWRQTYRYHEWHPAQVVGFQSDGYDNQLNTYRDLKASFGLRTYPDVWFRLRAHYPATMVDRMQTFITDRAQAHA